PELGSARCYPSSESEISMSIQLTPEQEHRIQTIVQAGAYRSFEEALDAAVAAVESAASSDFEGTDQELEELLMDGIHSGTPVEGNADYWHRLRTQTDAMVAEHVERKPLS